MGELMIGRPAAGERGDAVGPPCMAEVEAARAAARARFAHLAGNGGDYEDGHAPGPANPDNSLMTDGKLVRLRPAVEVASALVAASLRRRAGRD